MRMKVFDYIQNARQYIYRFGEIEPFKKIINSDKEEHYLIVPSMMAFYKKDFSELFTVYNPVAIIGISNCFRGTFCESYYFIHITRREIKETRVATYLEPAHLYRDDCFDPDAGKIRVADKYTEEYLSYLKSIDEWYVSKKCPKGDGRKNEYRNIPVDETVDGVIFPHYYFERNDEIRTLLRGEQIRELSDLAHIESVHVVDSSPVEIARIIGLNEVPVYPYIPEKDSVKYPKTNVQIHKNDIIEKYGRYFLVNKEAEFELYAPPGSHVIRAKEVSPEYLYLYLTSNIAYRIKHAFSAPLMEPNHTSACQIEEFPIVMPKRPVEEYSKEFEIIANPDERFYGKLYEKESVSTISDILQKDSFERIKLNNRELLQKHILSDMEEMRVCFENKAYKAMAILAGAFLEAFLIDWLSEIDGKPYFEKPMYFVSVNSKGKVKKKKAEFCEYIERIKQDYSPMWDNCATDADMIRGIRNRIHIKVCLRRSETIDEAVCRDILEKLEQIIDSRNDLTQ